MHDNLDTEGLDYLQWSLFDSPDEKGSGYRFMEREPVYILDRIVKKTRRNFNILLGYTTPKYANKFGLSTKDSHRIGRAVRLKILNPKKRMDLVRLLVLEGVTRIAIAKDLVYYDTDDLKERGLIVKNHDDDRFLIFFPKFSYMHTLTDGAFEVISESR